MEKEGFLSTARNSLWKRIASYTAAGATIGKENMIE